MGKIIESEFGNRPKSVVESFIVTVQFQFRVDAPNSKTAEGVILNGISMSARLAPYLVSQGAQADSITPDLLRSMGIDPEKLNG